MSSQAKLKVALIIVLCIFVCALVLGAVTNASWLFGRVSDAYGDLSIGDDEEVYDVAYISEPLSSFEFEGDELKGISIDWAAGGVDVRVAETHDGLVHVTEYAKGPSKQQPMKAVCEDGILKISYNVRFSLFSGCSFGTKIAVVELPQSVAGNLERFDLDGASGRYDFAGLDCDSMRLRIASGKIRCADITTRELGVEITSGSLEMAASVETSLGIHITSGNISLDCEGKGPEASSITMISGKVQVDFKGGAPATNSIKVTSGNLTIAIPEDSGFQVAVDRTSGNFSCKLPCENAGDACFAGDRTSRFDISLTSGSVELRGLATS